MLAQKVYLDNFELIRQTYMPDVDMTAYLLVNKMNNLRVIKVVPNDVTYTEASYCAAFFTPPTDSSGVQHIVEHSVLCGSKHFNLKEPFQVLLQSSLQTYLNAATYTEHTIYPFVTRNEQDFYNIMEIYTDAAYNPNIHSNELIFKQEGHNLNIQDGKLLHKGVVLNEMKGALSSAERIGVEQIKEMLFRDGNMRFNSGGNPEEIQNLTWEQFKDFHKKHYTTDNSVIVIVSHYDLEKELTIIDKYTKNSFRGDKITMTLQKEQVTESKTIQYSTKKENDENVYMNGFLLYDTKDVSLKESVALEIIDTLIHDSPASPFKEALGGHFSSSLDATEIQAYIIITTRGSKLPFDEYQTKLSETYSQLTQNSDKYLNIDSIQAAFNKLKMQKMQIKEHHGLTVIQQILKAALYDESVDKFMRFKEVIDEMYKDPYILSYFRSLISKYFQKSVSLNMQPHLNLNEIKHAQEEALLQKQYDDMTQAEKDQIVQIQLEVEQRQQQPNNPSELAKVKMLEPKDLQKVGNELLHFKGEFSKNGGLSHFTYNVKSADICYQDYVFDVTQSVSYESIGYIMVAKRILTRVPTDKYDTIQLLNQQIDNITSGVKTYLKVIDDHNSKARVLFCISVKFLIQYADDVSILVKDIVETSYKHLDNELLTSIISQYKNQLKQDLSKGSDAYSLISNRCLSEQSEAAALYDYQYGLKFLQFLESVQIDELLKQIDKIAKTLKNECPVLFAYAGQGQNTEKCQQSINKIFQVYSSSDGINSRLYEINNTKHANIQKYHSNSVATSINVNYVAKGFNFDRKIDSAALLLTDQLLSRSFLWDNVRVIGGAYGCFLVSSMRSRYYLVSYRDPNIAKTAETYEKIPNYLQNLEMTEQELFTQKIGAIGAKQKSIAPEQRYHTAFNYFIEQVDVENYANLVNGIINVTLDDIRKTSTLYQKLTEQKTYVFGKSEEVKKQCAGEDVDVL